MNKAKNGLTSPMSGRNYGIDLLRLVSMLYVVILHTCRQGGIMGAASADSPQFIANWFMQIWSFGAVNIFALISGYVSYSDKEKPIKYSNYIGLWLQVVFYGAGMGLLFNYFQPDAVTKTDFIKMFFPVTNSLYWYFTAYTALFFLIPLINAGIRHCSKQQLKAVFAFLLVSFSFIEVLVKAQKLDNGYSFAWLFVLYVMGAIMKKCEIGKNMKAYQAFLGIIVITVAGLLWKLYGPTFEILSFKVDRNTFILYPSPVMVVSAILHLIAFSKIKVDRISQRVIAYLAPGSFAVYLLNTQYYVWHFWLKNRFALWAEEEWYMMVLLVLGFSLVFVIGSIFIDRIRMFLFRVCGINKLILLVDKGINKLVYRPGKSEKEKVTVTQ